MASRMFGALRRSRIALKHYKTMDAAKIEIAIKQKPKKLFKTVEKKDGNMFVRFAWFGCAFLVGLTAMEVARVAFEESFVQSIEQSRKLSEYEMHGKQNKK